MFGIAPNGFIRFGSIESVKFPNDLLGTMQLRSSYLREGFAPGMIGIVDPGFNGTLTIPLRNPTNELWHFYYGQRICHLIFHELSEPVHKGDEYDGEYQQSEGAKAGLAARAKKSGISVVREVGGFAKHLTEEFLIRLGIELARNPERYSDFIQHIRNIRPNG